jgi:signal transduction histidine kinase
MSDITKIKLSEEELKNKISEELDKNREKDRILIQQSKLAAMGEMLGNIAHQWRQPLNNISLFLSFIKDGYKNEKITFDMLEKYFDKSFKQIEYMSQTIDDFRNFYKPSKQKNRFDIKHAIDSTIEIIKAQLKDENINLQLDISENILYGFENELKQSLLNIFNNALDAIKSKSKEKDFEKYIKVDSSEENGFIKIRIENNGGKINEEIISKIFEPYFTTKFESQGTGIGLYMTKSIIETNMNGKIEVENIEEGVVFTIKLPILKGNENE